MKIERVELGETLAFKGMGRGRAGGRGTSFRKWTEVEKEKAIEYLKSKKEKFYKKGIIQSNNITFHM